MNTPQKVYRLRSIANNRDEPETKINDDLQIQPNQQAQTGPDTPLFSLKKWVIFNMTLKKR